MARSEHPVERIVRLTVEAINARVDAIVESLKIDGRPIFSIKLTREEKLQRWLDPAARAGIEGRIGQTLGLEELENYRKEMDKLQQESGQP